MTGGEEDRGLGEAGQRGQETGGQGLGCKGTRGQGDSEASGHGTAR